jgi:hypothetical protein
MHKDDPKMKACRSIAKITSNKLEERGIRKTFDHLLEDMNKFLDFNDL